MYECDGCGLTGTLEEVEKHIYEDVKDAEGNLKQPSEIRCWGAMFVGGPAWEAYHNDGVHPMETFMQQVVWPAYAEYGIAQAEHLLSHPQEGNQTQ